MASVAISLCFASACPAPTLGSFRAPIIAASNHLTVSRHHVAVVVRSRPNVLCKATGRNRKPSALVDDNANQKRIVQASLWFAEAVYILWLFLLPYAPGGPVWAISPATINDLLGLSLNFFFILPLLNADKLVSCSSTSSSLYYHLVKSLIQLLGSVVGIHLVEAPILHPMAEGLFNFVIGWTFMFAPLLYTDIKRDRYKGSLDVLWGFQMFLTNTFLIPYMAIRLNDADIADGTSKKRSQLGTVMTNGAPVVGLIGCAICLISAVWAFYGRPDGNFGGIPERWEFLLTYLGSERLAYAFIWDICLYSIFQPWLIGANLQNLQEGNTEVVKYLRFVPVIGLVAYLLSLEPEDE
ncbi:unnamed protein product [Rhodiola kirilowii]